jgi:hypothetical protein
LIPTEKYKRIAFFVQSFTEEAAANRNIRFDTGTYRLAAFEANVAFDSESNVFLGR